MTEATRAALRELLGRWSDDIPDNEFLDQVAACVLADPDLGTRLTPEETDVTLRALRREAQEAPVWSAATRDLIRKLQASS